MAIVSVKMYPFAPTKVGTLPKGFNLKYSISWIGGLVSTSSMSRSLAFATANRTVDRAFSWFAQLVSLNQSKKALRYERRMTYFEAVELSERHVEFELSSAVSVTASVPVFEATEWNLCPDWFFFYYGGVALSPEVVSAKPRFIMLERSLALITHHNCYSNTLIASYRLCKRNMSKLFYVARLCVTRTRGNREFEDIY